MDRLQLTLIYLTLTSGPTFQLASIISSQQVNNCITAAWFELLGLSPQSQKAAEFASSFLYGSAYDFAIKEAVRHGQSLDEVLEHSTVEKCWAQIVGPEASKIGNVQDVAGDSSEANKSELLINVIPHEQLAKLTLPEHSAKLELVESAMENAKRHVRSQVQTIDGSQSLERLSKQMRQMECSKMRGTSDQSIVVLYVVDSSGEHEKDGRRSATPLRRDHLERVLRAWMCTRSTELPDLELEKVIFPPLHASDVNLGFNDVALGFQSEPTCLFEILLLP